MNLKARRREWVDNNHSEYLRLLGAAHHEVLRDILHSRLIDRCAELYGKEDFRIAIDELTMKPEQQSLGCYYEVFVRDSAGGETCPEGVEEVCFEAEELLNQEWVSKVETEIDLKLNAGA